MSSKLLRSILKKLNNLLIASNSLELSLHRNPRRRQKVESSAKMLQLQEFKGLSHLQLATLRVEDDDLRLVSRKKLPLDLIIS